MNKNLYVLILLCGFILNPAFSQTISISGKVVRHNGDPVEGALVSCTNTSPVASALDGSFTFNDLPAGENYFISGMHQTDVFDGITILDALFGRNMIIVPGFEFNEYQLFAGDLNNNFFFTTIDLVLMTRAAVKIDAGILGNNWYFFDQGGIQQGGIFLEDVSSDVSDLELIATKSGDVAIDSDHIPPPPGAPQPFYYLEDYNASLDDEFTIEIKVNDFKNIAGFQHALSWDPAVLEFVELEGAVFSSTWINEDLLGEGYFPIAGVRIDSLSNFELPDGTVLYSIKFKAWQDFSSLVGIVEITESIMPRQTVYRIENGDLFLLDDSFEIVESTSSKSVSNLEKFEIAPNPVLNEFFIRISFEQFENASLSLHDFSGKMITNWNLDGNNFEQSISVYELPKGTYALKLVSTNGITTKKLIKF